MMKKYFRAPQTIERLRIGLSGPFMDGFAQHLEAEGYATVTARGYLRAANHLGHYLKTQGVGFDVVDFDILEKFVEHLDSCCCPQSNGRACNGVVVGVKRFLEYLDTSSSLDIAPFGKQVEPEPLLVAKFKDWLKNQRGLSESTQRIYGLGAMAILDSMGSDPRKYDIEGLRSSMITFFNKNGPNWVNQHVSGIRMFLRYLGITGLCRMDLEHAISSAASRRRERPPSCLSEAEVAQIIASCEERTLMGIRDKAIILLFARLGLRAGDVAELRLSQIDWDDANILVSGKCPREERLPLSQEVGDALVAYIKKRPRVAEERLFLRIPAPHRPFAKHNSVSQIVTKRMHRAGVDAPRYGAHLLRHTAACQMLREGIGLYEIGRVLRHSSTDMTAYYARVDIKLLREVAQPWPEVLRC